MTEIPLSWWIQVVEIPALAGLFLWTKSIRSQAETQHEHLRETLEDRIEKTREVLATHKVEVAQKYASISYIRDVEKRLTDHLIRIEEKLEGRKRK
ncbi:MAG: hypothetical protein JXQ74_02615 [Alphaproteobacteria bacterium]|nr:hypothetical protein [Alphaproteobacteria bacterium]